MTKLYLYILLILLSCFSFVSCVYPPTQKKELDCTPTQPICKPYKLSIEKFDSLNYSIKRIVFSSDSNIAQISFSQNVTYLTSASKSNHSIYTATKLNYKQFDNINKYFDKSKVCGFISSRTNTLVYSEFGFIEDSLMNQLQAGLRQKTANKTISLEYLKESKYEWQSYPALSDDGRILFFASNRSGGFGGIDIWYSFQNIDGSWSKPYNCGECVNTPCDEISPFVKGNLLLFSSSGLAGFGAYDIFKTNIFYDDTFLRFSKAENLGPQVNTIENDICPTTPNSIDSLLYFSRNKIADFRMYCRINKTIIKDAFADNNTKITKNDNKQDKSNDSKKLKEIEQSFSFFGDVFSKSELKAISNAKINISRIDNDTIISLIADKKGKFNFRLKKGINYSISAHSENYFYDIFQLTVPTTDEISKVSHNFYLPKIAVLRLNFPLNVYDKPYEYVLDTNGQQTNITCQNEIQAASRDINIVLDKIKEIVISGYTDTANTESYNYQLGLKRALYVKNELIKLGIPAKILIIKSFGEKNILPKKENESDEVWALRQRRVTISKVMIK